MDAIIKVANKVLGRDIIRVADDLERLRKASQSDISIERVGEGERICHLGRRKTILMETRTQSKVQRPEMIC